MLLGDPLLLDHDKPSVASKELFEFFPSDSGDEVSGEGWVS